MVTNQPLTTGSTEDATSNKQPQERQMSKLAPKYSVDQSKTQSGAGSQISTESNPSIPQEVVPAATNVTSKCNKMTVAEICQKRMKNKRLEIKESLFINDQLNMRDP